MTEKLSKKEKEQKMQSSRLIYRIMQKALKHKDKISQDKEHLWLMLLDNSLQIKSLELLSIGTIKEVLSNPMEIFSIAFQKRAVKLILIHNHPSGNLLPSAEDIDNTDQIIQLGKMHDIPLVDKLIISTKDYFSFQDTGLFEELEMSLKYVPQYSFWEKVQEILANENNLLKTKRFIKL